jgi:uncharacterized protein YndB with AHSA1/START domain
MRSILRSTPLHLLAILAVAAITIGYAIRTGVTDPKWYSSVSVVFGVPVIVAVFMGSRWNVKAEAKQLDEGSIERFTLAQAYFAVTTTDLLAVLFAGAASPKVGLIILGVAAAWVLLWSPRALRQVGIRTKVVIQRDPSVVFAFISDFENEPKYLPGMEVEKITTGPIRSGTQFRSRLQMPNGTTFEGIEEIVDFEPPTRLTSRVASGLRPNVDVITIEPVSNGTLLKYRFETELTYPNAIIGLGLLRWLTNIELWNRRRAAWARVKQILESGQPSTSL